MRLVTDIRNVLLEQDTLLRAEINQAYGRLFCDPVWNQVRNRFNLTARETQVAILITKGLSAMEIAKRLELSPKTTRTYTYHIYHKLRVTNRTMAAVKMILASGCLTENSGK